MQAMLFQEIINLHREDKLVPKANTNLIHMPVTVLF